MDLNTPIQYKAGQAFDTKMNKGQRRMDLAFNHLKLTISPNDNESCNEPSVAVQRQELSNKRGPRVYVKIKSAFFLCSLSSGQK